MIDFMFWWVVIPLWVAGGAFAARKAIAKAEKTYLEASRKAYENNKRLVPQEVMDVDDWIGALLYGAGAFIFFPVIIVVWVLSWPVRWGFVPIRAFFLPPRQKEFEHHVTVLNNQKALVLATARTYQDVLGWEPEDHPDRLYMIQSLQETIKEQLEQLMKMTDPTRAYDGNYLSAAKEEIKALTAGAEL